MSHRTCVWLAGLGVTCCLNVAALSASAAPPPVPAQSPSTQVAVLSQPPADLPADVPADLPADVPADGPKSTGAGDPPAPLEPPVETEDPPLSFYDEDGGFDFEPLFKMTPLDQIRIDPMPDEQRTPNATSLTLDDRTFGDLRELRMEQGWNAQTLYWRPTNFAHRPLYFEDGLLERHGQKRGHMTQPFWSAAHFFGTFPILPYKMGVARPWECVYTLGYERPGSCKRSLRRRFVWEADAAAFESSAWIAAVLLLP